MEDEILPSDVGDSYHNINHDIRIPSLNNQDFNGKSVKPVDSGDFLQENGP